MGVPGRLARWSTLVPGPRAASGTNGSLSVFRQREQTRYRSRLLVSHGIYEVAETLGTQPTAQFTSVETVSPPLTTTQSRPDDASGQGAGEAGGAAPAGGGAPGS